MRGFGAFVIFFTLSFNFQASLSSRVIVIEDAKACFRRALTGRRISSSLVRKSVFCERLEECMRECAEERTFVCEGFNYRFDTLGKGQGDCELLDRPLLQLNLRRDVIPDTDYDYYERDRNSGQDCKEFIPQHQPNFRPYDRTFPNRDYGPVGDNGPRDRYDFPEHRNHRYYQDHRNRYYGDYEPPRPPPPPIYDAYEPNYPSYEGNRRGDKSYNYHSYHHSNVDEHNYQNYSEEEYYKYRRPFFPFPTRAYPYLPTGVSASPKKSPSQISPPKTSTTYLPSNPTTSNTVAYPNYSIRPTSPTFIPDYNVAVPPHDLYKDQRKYLPTPPQLYHRRPSFPLPTYPEQPLGKPYLPSDNHVTPLNYKSYEPYLPPQDNWRYDGYSKNKHFFWDNYFQEREKDWKYWGFDRRKEYGGGLYGNFGKPYVYFSPPINWKYYYPDYEEKHFQPSAPVYKPKEWNTYGGLYGYGGQRNYYDYHKNSYKYWGLNRYDDQRYFSTTFQNSLGHSRLPHEPFHGSFIPSVPLYDHIPGDLGFYANDYMVRKACSLRMASGFRLHRHIVRKFSAAKDIYECELQCYKENSFICSLYAYRYTQGPSVPPENCYLSEKSHKNLDYYVDLEPDRNFDVYTMNNKEMCHKLFISSPDYSDCFWRVRSGVRLDQSVVKDSLMCQSLLDCQLECLNARSFTCRAFSFRFEPSVPGGSIDNCQLTDWPFLELNPRIHLVPETSFELYERGSFGHGCEPFHFRIGVNKNTTSKNMDELCYVGYGSPAKILPIAAKSSVRVENDLECRKKCTEAREKLLFPCMSYSFRTNIPAGSPNCDLSDIHQSDLLPNIDYVFDKDSWLYAWNDYDPECVALIDAKTNSNKNENGLSVHTHGPPYPLDTWRMFSVNGWPCKSLSRQNKEAGFWFCEIEGAAPNSWDYCCRPDHQCGSSEGYSYQWCYVGPEKTQWRQCSDKYYPYARNIIIRIPERIPETYIPTSLHTNVITNRQPPFNFGFRPDRPPTVYNSPPYKSLDEYEKEFDSQFLQKPQMDMLGESKHWPVSYLHKEMPPNDTITDNVKLEGREMSNLKEDEEMPKPKDGMTNAKERSLDSKYEAISNLIDIIKQEELNDIKYKIGNKSDTSDGLLVVQIPLPSNFTKKEEQFPRRVMREQVIKKYEQESNELQQVKFTDAKKTEKQEKSIKPVYTRSYITKTTKPFIKTEITSQQKSLPFSNVEG